MTDVQYRETTLVSKKQDCTTVANALLIPRYTRIFGVIGLIGLVLGFALAAAASVPLFTFWTFSVPALAIAGIHFGVVKYIQTQKPELAKNLAECRVFWVTSASVLGALTLWVMGSGVL
jgi:hypothetical protein